jgi:predicted acetyltransferase
MGVTDYTIEAATADDWDDLYRVLETAFHDPHSDEAKDAERLFVEFDRTLVARRDGEVVGSAGILTRRLAVPGATVPAAHVTLVSVMPTARRQGVLRSFMSRQFADARAAGEPIAVLWASEGRIYQRFGYGLSATALSLTIETNEVRLTVPPPAGRLRESTPAALRDHMVKLYEEAYAGRPGWSERAGRHWDYRLSDVAEWRRGATELRAVSHEDPNGVVDGYALWRAERRWGNTGPSGEVRVMELVATTPDAYGALWQHLLTMDLTRTVNVWLCAPDEPLLHAVSDPRRLDARLHDALWVRVLDVPAALAARRYATEVDVVFEVSDAMIAANAGRWRLQGSPTDARCAATSDAADLSCDVKALGAVYLGGTSLSSLAATGQVVEHTAGALARADAALRWHRAPTSPEVF